ncbi:MAG TPA: acyl-CoA synthetase [Burkholderiaceae bacterium]|nr:acyl-CoA synthetase [Burkholderiaceae bacterium]
MHRPHLLDLRIGPDWPDLSTAEAVRAFESIPYDERIAARSTYEAIRIGAAVDPAAPAITFLPNADPDEAPVVFSHAQVLARITQAANAFTALGVGKDDVVSFLLPLLPHAFYTLYGAEAAGIANPVNPLLEPYQLVEILRAANTKVLVALGPMPGADIWEKVQRIRAELPELAAVVAVNGASVATAAPPKPGEPAPAGAAPVYDFDALVGAQRGDALESGREISADDACAYFHTGGTTGTPKLVRHTHRNQVCQAWTIGLMLRQKPGESILFGLPLFHVGGALTQGLSTLASGGNMVVLSPSGWRSAAAQRNVWRLVETFRPSTFGGVPTVLAAALHAPSDGLDLSSLKRASGGGSAIPVAVGRTYVEKFGIPVLEVYGMTETSSVHTIAFADRPLRLGSVGHPVPYARVRIVKVDAQGRCTGDCATDEIGVVAMAGPGVFSGYLSEKHNREAFVEPGWVNSGDLGRLDADGYLWITGRAKDLVIRGGHNIDPQPVEEILFGHPAVALAAMVGQPDAYAGELPVAYVQPKPGASIDPNELVDFVRERTPERAAVPVAVHLVDPMPLTGVGKVFKPALRWDAARRVAERMLADLGLPGLRVEAGAHPVHGNLITVTVAGAAPDARAELERRVQERLGPLTMRHEVAFEG